MASIKRNFSYNLLLTSCNYIFPLIVYPYISRVLGVTNIGTCNFVDSIVNYFILFAQLGIGSYGVREIARYKDNLEKRNEIFSNLFVINVFTFTIATIALIICTYTIEIFIPYRQFLFVGILKLLSTLFLIEWFFQGIEQFKYITIRSVVVRCVYVLCVFIFVHNQDDTIIYYGLTSMVIVLNAIFNWNYSQRFKRLSFKNITPATYLYPIIVFGYYRILTSMYTTFNITYLGFVRDTTEVGYFTTATKLYTIIMGAFTAFTTVMVPRVSYMLEQGKKDELQKMVDKTIALLVSFAIPVILLCIFNSHTIIQLISGNGYEGAELPFRIVICLLIIIGMEQIIIQQFIMASKRTKLVLILSTVGAFVGIFMNLTITPTMGAVGSSIAWGVSELSVLFTGIYMFGKYLGLYINWRNITFSFVRGVVYIPLLLCSYVFSDSFFRFVTSSVLITVFFIWSNRKLYIKNLSSMILCKK